MNCRSSSHIKTILWHEGTLCLFGSTAHTIAWLPGVWQLFRRGNTLQHNILETNLCLSLSSQLKRNYFLWWAEGFAILLIGFSNPFCPPFIEFYGFITIWIRWLGICTVTCYMCHLVNYLNERVQRKIFNTSCPMALTVKSSN